MTNHTIKRWATGASVAVLCASGVLTACSRKEAAPPAASASTASQATVPPPPGDSTPKPAEATARAVAEANEKTGASGPQSTVGSAAAGAPPYTLNSAPEGNQAPAQGTKSGEPPRK